MNLDNKNSQSHINFNGKNNHIATVWREAYQRMREATKAKKEIGERLKARRQRFNQILNKIFNPETDTPEQRNGDQVVETETVKRIEYNSDNLAAAIEAGEINRTSTGLLDGVFLLGSTNSKWREETVALALAADNIVSYNPNMADWNPDLHPKAEALGMSEFAVLAMRIENKLGVTDGSLGSLVEVGMAAFSALVNGQKVLVTFDETFQGSLVEPGAIAQFEALKVKFEYLSLLYTDLLQVEYNCSRDRYVQLAKKALEDQRAAETALQPITAERIKRFAEQRRARLINPKRFVVYGGSSAPFSRSLERSYHMKQALIQQTWGRAEEMTVLNQPPFSHLWEQVDKMSNATGISEQERRLLVTTLMRDAFLAEQDPKNEADVLLWTVQEEAISKAAITEIGFMLLNALEKGQQFNILLEDFDADKYIQTMIAENLDYLEESAPGDPVLDQFKKDPNSVTLKMVSKSLALAATALFKKADNAKRTRSIAQAQLRKIAQKAQEIIGDQSVELFSFSTDFTDYVQKIRLVHTPEAFEGRERYYATFTEFKKKMQSLVEQNSSQKGKAHELVVEAVRLSANPDMDKAQGLLGHLDETERTTELMRDVIAQSNNAKGQPYLSTEHMTLLVNHVAPLHDYMKLLGAPGQQALSDHEVLAGYVVNKFYPQLGFSDEEVDFLVRVISNHENIFKENGRDVYGKSADPAERAIALFSLIDCLGLAISFDNNVISLNPDGLQSRFTDLYKRHINPSTSKLAVMRPEWGLYTITDFLATFDVLADQYGLQVALGTRNQLIDAGIAAIDNTIEEDKMRKNYPANYNPENKIPLLTEEQLNDFNEIKSQFEQMKKKAEVTE